MRVLCVLATVFAMSGTAGQKGTPEDEAAIRQVIADWTAAFNRHEANQDVTTAGFTDDFDAVIPTGAHVKGKPDLREAFRTFLKNASKTETVEQIRFIRPDVAVVDGRYEYMRAEIKPQPKGMDTWVLTKENGRWRMTALRMMIPPAPPPKP